MKQTDSNKKEFYDRAIGDWFRWRRTQDGWYIRIFHYIRWGPR